MRPRTTPDINDTAADLHDTAAPDAIRTVDLNDGAVTTSDATEMHNGQVVIERDDSAEGMATKKRKGFFGGGEVQQRACFEKSSLSLTVMHQECAWKLHMHLAELTAVVRLQQHVTIAPDLQHRVISLCD